NPRYVISEEYQPRKQRVGSEVYGVYDRRLVRWGRQAIRREAIRLQHLLAQRVCREAIDVYRGAICTQAIHGKAIGSRTIGARNGHHQRVTGHRNGLVSSVVNALAAVAEILVGRIDKHHVLHSAAVARYPVVINTIAAQEFAPFGIE